MIVRRCGCVDSVERLGDGERGCGRLLPRVQRHRVRRQRDERPSVDPAAGTDDSAQRARNQESERDAVGSRGHQPLHASESVDLITDMHFSGPSK